MCTNCVYIVQNNGQRQSPKTQVEQIRLAGKNFARRSTEDAPREELSAAIVPMFDALKGESDVAENIRLREKKVLDIMALA